MVDVKGYIAFSRPGFTGVDKEPEDVPHQGKEKAKNIKEQSEKIKDYFPFPCRFGLVCVGLQTILFCLNISHGMFNLCSIHRSLT